MMIAAAEVIAGSAPPGALVPDLLDRALHERVAGAVRERAILLGLKDTLDLGKRGG